MFRIQPAFLLLLVFIGMAACKKSKDEEPPSISLTAPRNFSQYQYGQEIPVEGTIKDDRQLESVSIRMVDENLTPVLPSKSFSPDGESFTLNTTYSLDDVQMPSGKYYLRVSGTDGENETKEFVELSFVAIPKERTGIMLVTTPTANQVELVRVGNDLAVVPFKTISGDYSGSSTSSSHQYINVLGRYTGDLTSLSLVDASTRWTVPVISNTQVPYFENLDLNGELNYVSRHDGEILGYDAEGGIQFSALVDAFHYPEKVFVHNNLVFAQLQKLIGSGKFIASYFQTGVEKKRLEINFDIAGFGGLSEDELLLFANDNGQGRILVFPIEGTTLWEPGSVPTGSFRKVIPLNAEEYLVALDGTIYRYNYANNQTFEALVGTAVITDFAYDDALQQLVVATGNQLEIYAYPSGALIGQYSHSQNIEAVHVLYNR